MKYFLHDSNSFNDEKVTELFIKFGYEGLGLFYTVLEKLAQQEKPVKTSVLKSQLRVGKKLEKCWKFMEEIDIISSNNGETFNKQLLNFSENYKIKKEKNRIRIANFREKQKNVTCNESVSNAPKVKESKVNKSKVKEYNSSAKKIDNGLTPIGSIFKEKFNKPVNTKKWQDLALEIIETIPDAKDKKSSIFKCCKDNEARALTALNDCKELGRLHVLYFLKVYNELIKN